jgi:MinD-like ATPase involved in chromosome partitioning or flagellar assembly
VRLAFAVPLEVEDRLAEDCRRYGHEIIARCDGADELAALLAERRTEAAVVATSPRYLTTRLLAEADLAGTRLIGMTSSAADQRHASTLGLYELVGSASEWHEIEALLVGVPAPAGAPVTPALADSTASTGTVIAVWGPAGAPGRTSMAITIAAELAASGHSVVLADADTYSGTIAPALGLLDESPGFAAACRLAGAGAFTAAEFDRIAQPFGSGARSFRVLTGIGRPHRWPELSAARVAAVLTAMRGWADFVVVDTGFNLERDEEISSDLHAPRRNAATLTALSEADRVVAVGAADPVGLSRFLRAHVDLLETITTDKILVVMNRVRASAIGLNPGGQIAETLYRFGGISSPALVPYDRVAFDAALLAASTLTDAAGRSQARQAVRELVGRRILDPAAAPSRRRLGRGRVAPKERLA